MGVLGKLQSLIGSQHEAVRRDYLARVTDAEYPKDRAATLAKDWGYHYWDGDRRINYGGYHFVPGYWTNFAQGLIRSYGLSSDSRVLDVGCGKGYLLRELLELLPGITVRGVDISEYAIDNCDPIVRGSLTVGSATGLPFEDKSFDLVLSINTLHNLYAFDLNVALKELERVGVEKFLVVESYRTETEKMNLLYWQVTCEAFCTPKEWMWWFGETGYTGDYEFIYFG